MKAIAVIIPRLCTTAMTDALMHVAPLLQATVDGVFIRVDTRAWCNRALDQRLDRPLLHIVQHANNHLATALDHPEDRGFLRCEGPAATFPLEASAPAAPPFFITSSGFPLWPATMETSSHSTTSVHV